MMDVVEAEAALDAQAVLVGRAVAAVDVEDLVVLDVDLGLAADAAIGAERIDRLASSKSTRLPAGVEQARLHQRAGRAGLHALAAGDAGRAAHRVVEVEHDLRAVAAIGHADHVVDLHLAAGAHAEAAMDAGVEIDRHGRMRAVGGGLLARRESGCVAVTPIASTQSQKLGFGIVRIRAPGWSASSSSNTISRDFTARSDWPSSPSCPAAALRMQEAASTRSPSTSTMQARQLPSAR